MPTSDVENTIQNVCYSVKFYISSLGVLGTIPNGEKQILESKINETISWMGKNPNAKSEEFEKRQETLEVVAISIFRRELITGVCCFARTFEHSDERAKTKVKRPSSESLLSCSQTDR